MLKTWTITGFKGRYPVGTAAVVHAETRQIASELLNASLRQEGLPGDTKPEDFDKFPRHTALPDVRVLCDGDY